MEEHGWETWTWDPSLFAGTAEHYIAGRLPYAPGLAGALTDALGLDGTGRLLDVGCGPGAVALALADRFAEVVGLDPDADMVAAAAARGAANARWVQLRAEDLPAGLGTFRAITFAASFHWMDRPVVAAAVATMLDPGGAVVQVHAPTPSMPCADEIRTLRDRYLGPITRAGRSFRTSSPEGEDAVFRAAGFAPMEVILVPDGRVLRRAVDDLIAFQLSLSSSAPHLFGDDLAAFVADLRSLLHEAQPTEGWHLALCDTELRVWRLEAEPHL